MASKRKKYFSHSDQETSKEKRMHGYCYQRSKPSRVRLFKICVESSRVESDPQPSRVESSLTRETRLF